MSNDNIHPEDLLSAYADGGLDGADLERVEAYLASHPDAVADVEALRETLAKVRGAAQKDGAATPDWDLLAARIGAAVDEEKPTAAPPKTWFRWQPMAAGTFLAAAAAVLVLFLWPPTTTTQDPLVELTPGAPGIELEFAELEGLDRALADDGVIGDLEESWNDDSDFWNDEETREPLVADVEEESDSLGESLWGDADLDWSSAADDDLDDLADLTPDELKHLDAHLAALITG